MNKTVKNGNGIISFHYKKIAFDNMGEFVFSLMF